MAWQQQNFDEETAAARQRLIEQLQQLSRALPHASCWEDGAREAMLAVHKIERTKLPLPKV